MGIVVKNLVKKFEGKNVIDDISFSVGDGETLGIVGFSGSGKSTILKLISKLLYTDGGTIETTEGDIAMTFQYSALFDFLDVFDNISFPLVERPEFRGKYNREALEKIVEYSLKILGLKDIEHKYPSELRSGSKPVTLRLGTFNATKSPPINAINTNIILPRLFIIGIKIFAKVCALVASLQSWSFFLSKSIFDCSSWQKVLTTF